MKTQRKNMNTTLNQDLWFRLKLIAWNMSQYKKQIHVNDLLEESMRMIIHKYESYLPEEYKLPKFKEINDK